MWVMKYTLDGWKMMDRALVRSVAARTGLGRKFISKENRISLLLKEISELKDMDMVLKGGTAINRIHLRDNARFSEDIDIDLLGNASIDEKINLIGSSLEKVQGFKIKGPRMMHLIARYDCYYQDEFDERDRIMLDFYMANADPVSVKVPERTLVTSSVIETNPSLFKVYSLEDLIAQKIMALGNRVEGKDVYDLFFALKLDFSREQLMEATELRAGLRNDERKAIEVIGSILERRELFQSNWSMIMNSTNHYIPRSKRPQWKAMISGLFDILELLTVK